MLKNQNQKLKKQKIIIYKNLYKKDKSLLQKIFNQIFKVRSNND
jgi:hypothetical protein